MCTLRLEPKIKFDGHSKMVRLEIGTPNGMSQVNWQEMSSDCQTQGHAVNPKEKNHYNLGVD